MAIYLEFATSQLLGSLASSSSPTLAFSSSNSSSSRLNYGFTSSKSKLLNGVQTCTPFLIKERASLVKASDDIDGTGSGAAKNSPESKEQTVPVENLPLESKFQLTLEANTRMKSAKKIRLRRSAKVTCHEATIEEERQVATFKNEQEQKCVNVFCLKLS